MKPDSTTETFVALKLEVDNWRWADVPFFLRTGKRLAEQTLKSPSNSSKRLTWFFAARMWSRTGWC